jgi:RNA polymerase sigma-70 factor, ECF subfamily
MRPERAQDQFVRHLTSCQPRLHAYILSLLPNWNDANDVLQDTNLVIWHRSEEFIEGTNFLAWAYAIARYKVLAHHRDRHRDRHIFDDELFALVADQAEHRALPGESAVVVLKGCMKELSPLQREMLRQRYAKNGSVQEMARVLGRSAAVVSVTLSRIRHRLMACVRRKLEEETQS